MSIASIFLYYIFYLFYTSNVSIFPTELSIAWAVFENSYYNAKLLHCFSRTRIRTTVDGKYRVAKGHNRRYYS